jgi:cytosine/adenosine deaminase-related metal-dependent hydrolase
MLNNTLSCTLNAFLRLILALALCSFEKTSHKLKPEKIAYTETTFTSTGAYLNTVMKIVSTLYVHGTVVTINTDRHIILDGAPHVINSKIIETLLLWQELPGETRIVDPKHKIIIPGLTNTHAHTAQSLLRGLAEHLPLQPWLCDSIWPLEANYSSDDGYAAASLTITEMLKSGTTCFLESKFTIWQALTTSSKLCKSLELELVW